MLIKYICKNCNSKRIFSSIQKEIPLCKICNSEMKLCKNNVAVNIFSTPESRYLGDEALFGTIADRISGKHKQKHC